jgi:hypothetical protein
MDKQESNSGACAPIERRLRTRENRAKLLRAGFTGKEIEELYIFLEGLIIVPVDWREAATKLTGTYHYPGIETHYPGSVQAAEAGVSA